MTNFSRKIKRKKRLAARKTMQKQFENMLRVTSTMEKLCGTCGKDFSDVSKEEGLGWMVRFNGMTTQLQCDVCFAAENNEDDSGE